MRNKVVSSMQKTYDECFLSGSTGIFFEQQGNDADALREYRKTLDRIYYFIAYRLPSNFTPKDKLEQDLFDALQNLERRCKERKSFIEAQNQGEAGKQSTEGKTADTRATGAASSMSDRRSGSAQTQGSWIEGRSTPSIVYPDLTGTAPALPARPAPTTARSSESQISLANVDKKNSISPLGALPPRHGPQSRERTSRTPSPEKKSRMMKTTLRNSRDQRKPSKTKEKSESKAVSTSSQAAGMAWDAIARNSGQSAGSVTPRHNSLTSTGLPYRTGPRELSPTPRFSDDLSRKISQEQPPSPPAHQYSPQGGQTDFLRPMASSSNIDLALRQAPSYESLPRQSLNPVTQTSKAGSAYSAGRPPVPRKVLPPEYIAYRNEYPTPIPVSQAAISAAVNPPTDHEIPDSPTEGPGQRSPGRKPRAPPPPPPVRRRQVANAGRSGKDATADAKGPDPRGERSPAGSLGKERRTTESTSDGVTPPSSGRESPEGSLDSRVWQERLAYVKKHLPKGVDPEAAKQIFNEIVVHGDEVHWSDVAGLDAAKGALKEAVVYPFLRPDLFSGLREPARGMLLFGPPGTGKTMLARAVATESRSTFFAISASSLTSKWLGESEKLVRALFSLAKALAPSIIFVDEIDSLLSSRGGSSEHESTRRIKTEFLIQWSDLQRAAAGREQSAKDKKEGDPTRVLVLAATNLPWAIDEAARRRFVRRQYIPLPEAQVRAQQLQNLLGHQKHSLNAEDLEVLVHLTEGYSGSDITALAKDAAMGPLRSLGEALLHMAMDEIRPIRCKDFEASLATIRPSVSRQGLQQFEDWAKEFGERGG